MTFPQRFCATCGNLIGDQEIAIIRVEEYDLPQPFKLERAFCESCQAIAAPNKPQIVYPYGISRP